MIIIHYHNFKLSSYPLSSFTIGVETIISFHIFPSFGLILTSGWSLFLQNGGYLFIPWVYQVFFLLLFQFPTSVYLFCPRSSSLILTKCPNHFNYYFPILLTCFSFKLLLIVSLLTLSSFNTPSVFLIILISHASSFPLCSLNRYMYVHSYSLLIDLS